jgi:hypothetical protein
VSPESATPASVPATPATGVRPSPLTELRRRWPLTTLLLLAGLFLGLGAAQSRPVEYTSEARLVVGALDVSSQSVPGFALATQQLATTYSRLIVGDQVQLAVRRGLGARADDLVEVRASPIPESAVIRVEAVATRREVSLRATDASARALLDQVNRLLLVNPGEALLKQFAASRTEIAAATVALQQAQRAVTRAETRQQREQAATAQQAAQSQLDTLQLESEALGTRYQQTVNGAPGAPVQSIAKAVVTGDDRLQTRELLGLAGLAVGGLVALLVCAALSARRVRRGR